MGGCQCPRWKLSSVRTDKFVWVCVADYLAVGLYVDQVLDCPFINIYGASCFDHILHIIKTPQNIAAKSSQSISRMLPFGVNEKEKTKTKNKMKFELW